MVLMYKAIAYAAGLSALLVGANASVSFSQAKKEQVSLPMQKGPMLDELVLTFYYTNDKAMKKVLFRGFVVRNEYAVVPLHAVNSQGQVYPPEATKADTKPIITDKVTDLMLYTALRLFHLHYTLQPWVCAINSYDVAVIKLEQDTKINAMPKVMDPEAINLWMYQTKKFEISSWETKLVDLVPSLYWFDMRIWQNGKMKIAGISVGGVYMIEHKVLPAESGTLVGNESGAVVGMAIGSSKDLGRGAMIGGDKIKKTIDACIPKDEPALKTESQKRKK